MSDCNIDSDHWNKMMKFICYLLQCILYTGWEFNMCMWKFLRKKKQRSFPTLMCMWMPKVGKINSCWLAFCLQWCANGRRVHVPRIFGRDESAFRISIPIANSVTPTGASGIECPQPEWDNRHGNILKIASVSNIPFVDVWSSYQIHHCRSTAIWFPSIPFEYNNKLIDSGLPSSTLIHSSGLGWQTSFLLVQDDPILSDDGLVPFQRVNVSPSV